MTLSIKLPRIAVVVLALCLNQAFAQTDKVYDYVSVETPPSYPGGIAKFYEFLGSTIKYPKEAASAKKEGTLHLSFVVEKDGTLTNIKNAGRELGDGLDEEGIRALNLSRSWNPGIIGGKPVRVKYSLPIKFTTKK
ncbi:MAG: energy transducer TonB [Pedobacter sp.]|nr:MAG: energy transducer TonB [Pedobacter sp.]